MLDRVFSLNQNVTMIIPIKASDFKYVEKYDATINPQMYAWFVWQKGFQGNPTIKWIHNKR